jgi:hypothetical protein
MRFPKSVLVGLVAVGLVGCSGTASGPPSVSTPPTAQTTASSVPLASPQMKAGARAAASQFYGLYSASRFAASWNLLAPATKRHVLRHVWVSVHEACPSIGTGKPRTIKAMTVFGDAAIVTESITGVPSQLGTAEDIFSYANGHWSYSPQDLNIYLHGSVTADIAAAKAAGFCTSWKLF